MEKMSSGEDLKNKQETGKCKSNLVIANSVANCVSIYTDHGDREFETTRII